MKSMANTWECPNCGRSHDYSHNPDVVRDLSPQNLTTFDCDCGKTFNIYVDFDPIFTVDETSVHDTPGFTPKELDPA